MAQIADFYHFSMWTDTTSEFKSPKFKLTHPNQHFNIRTMEQSV